MTTTPKNVKVHSACDKDSQSMLAEPEGWEYVSDELIYIMATVFSVVVKDTRIRIDRASRK